MPEYAGGGFSRTIANSSLFMESMYRLFPQEEQRVNLLFPMGGNHLSLALNKEKGCFFLGAAGCLLPGLARPRFCLLFPFWVMGGGLNLFNDHNCLAMQECRRPSSLMLLFGVDRAEIMRRYALLRLDWGFTQKVEAFRVKG
ncbi:MAG: hypothetical protein LBD82_00325 [Deltaproteobacteria bacterium]|nr:hypothetical protein [Deltaproteobacteria bacterium]